jgi:TolA-binding protein
MSQGLRLKDEADARLRAALEAAGDDEPTAAELSAVLARLPLEGSAPAPAKAALGAKGASAALAGLVLAAGAWWAWSSPTPVRMPPPAPVAASPVPTAPPTPQVDAKLAPPAEPEAAPRTPAPAVRAPRPAAPAPSSPAQERAAAAPAPLPEPAVPDELETITAAYLALRSGKPDEALVRVAQHERLFPDGRLAQEREVIAIEAWRLEGDLAQARAALDRFRQRWPESGHLVRLEAVFDGG